MFMQRQFTPKNSFFYGNFLCSLAIGFILDVCHAYIGASNVEKTRVVISVVLLTR